MAALVVSLEGVLAAESSSVEAFQTRLLNNGFCLVQLPPNLTKEVEALSSKVVQFFEQDEPKKRAFSEDTLGGEALEGLVYGYNYTSAYLIVLTQPIQRTSRKASGC